jgi:preprotein translocase subunit SecA
LTGLLGEARYREISDQPLGSIQAEERMRVVDELGRQALTEIYRQLLLGVISELWVDYLTSMEALRVSIGLEAYGQRDPLVQYKNRAFDMFRELLENMRTGVVSRMFTFRPRDLSSVQTSVTASRPETLALPAAQPAEGAAVAPSAGNVPAASASAPATPPSQKPAGAERQGKSKRRRRRR